MTGFKPRIYGIGGYQLSHNHCVKWVNFDHLFKNWPFVASFLFSSIQKYLQNLMRARFEPGPSGVGRFCSTSYCQTLRPDQTNCKSTVTCNWRIVL